MESFLHIKPSSFLVNTMRDGTRGIHSSRKSRFLNQLKEKNLIWNWKKQPAEKLLVVLFFLFLAISKLIYFFIPPTYKLIPKS